MQDARCKNRPSCVLFGPAISDSHWGSGTRPAWVFVSYREIFRLLRLATATLFSLSVSMRPRAMHYVQLWLHNALCQWIHEAQRQLSARCPTEVASGSRALRVTCKFSVSLLFLTFLHEPAKSLLCSGQRHISRCTFGSVMHIWFCHAPLAMGQSRRLLE